MLRRIAFAAVTAVLWANSAAAADIPPAGPPAYQPPPVVLPGYDWTSIYIGVNGGYVTGRGTGTLTVTGNPFVFGSSSGTADAAGGFGGAQIGANWQTGFLVIGAEADGQWSSQTVVTPSTCGFGCTLSETVKSQWFATARLRMGAGIDRFLLYVTGGAAFSGFSYDLTASGFGLTTNVLKLSQSKVGWTGGGGIEAGITNYLSVKAEYLFIATDNIAASGPIPLALGGGTAAATVKLQNHVIRAGLNLRLPIR